MGKKARKTRWRTLDITDEQSDSEESHITTSPRLLKSFHQKSYYNKLPYSSQSTPRRKYQHESNKSTRSSSTASENKITFNEDEYTRITTPRQDVLFKKGYLNKPKNYQTQTSTGTSTTSTGNSTGNGTPDHQSTDLEYDSQFVFPNSFIHQNGIYYVNSFEPYPLMLYNPPTYYTECSNSKTKRYSTGSLTESTSPNNEEATSQDLSGGEASNNVSDYSGHHNVYNMVYPGYYVNGVCTPQEAEVDEYPTDQVRKIKKRRRRKTSRSQANNQDSTEGSEDEEPERTEIEKHTEKSCNHTCNSNTKDCSTDNILNVNDKVEESTEDSTKTENKIPADTTTASDEEKSEVPKPPKYDLKADAEEFVPRAFRTPEIPLNPVQFIKVPPNFVPIPIVPFNGQVSPAFIPPGGIPINFIPRDPKMFPNFINFVPAALKNEEIVENIKELNHVPNDQNFKTNLSDDIPTKSAEKIITNDKTVDIATVVSKLEEAVKEQEENEEVKRTHSDSDYSPKKKQYVNNQKYRNKFKRNFYNSPRSSPLNQRRELEAQNIIESNEIKHIVNDTQIQIQTEPNFVRNSPERFRKNWKHQNSNSRWQQNIHKSTKQNQRVLSNTESINHHSDTVKNDKINSQKVESPKQTMSPTKVYSLKLPDQWISVSSRKKRKNKNVDESPVSIDDTTTIDEGKDDQFQSYDVNLLVDVIPPSSIKEETLTIELTESKIENINNIAQTEPETTNCITISEIEHEIITEEQKVDKDLPKEVEEDIVPEIITVQGETKSIIDDTKSIKKKSKKNSQKPPTKRVLITDIYLSNECEEPKTSIKKIVRKVETPKEKIEIKPLERTEITEEQEEKKLRKKKKKSSKPATASSLSSSTTTLSLAEDAFDILLDLSVSKETDKTNDEISVELNKIIQKGMYTNLEEKMKSLNISEGDGFFKSVFSKMPLSEKTEATGFLKSPDFSKITLFKSDPVSDEKCLETKKTNDELPPSESPEIFLENPDQQPRKSDEECDAQKSLYPITEAVKEWMCRTRETTPDVEIFKSPITIYNEFYNSDTNSDTEVCETLTANELSASVDDEDEITLFTAENVQLEGEDSSEDLLEYWEDWKPEDTATEKKSNVRRLNDDEEELEVYESVYGKNNYLNIQKEIIDKTNTNFPKHGNLPYRAICCNIM